MCQCELSFLRVVSRVIFLAGFVLIFPNQFFSKNPGPELNLNNVWIKKDTYRTGPYFFQRKCRLREQGRNTCSLTIHLRRALLREFRSEWSEKEWLRFGLISLLGKKSKQLIVFNYSGGAHCCYDYTIFDLEPRFRVIYDSSTRDSANEIGNQLTPVDIDGNGIYEFYQEVMAFDYFGPGGHATAAFPPAIFAYDGRKRLFELANKKFPDFVLQKLKENIDGLADWRKENESYGTQITDEEIAEITVRNTFLYMIYAGKRTQAWEYFEMNYKSHTGGQYRDQFRDQFRREFKSLFAKDPTYRSIYGR
jgi:hypothetical protein